MYLLLAETGAADNLLLGLTQAWPYVTLAVIVLLILMVALREVVPPEFADVVLRRKKHKVYSAATVAGGTGKAVYYRIPAWVPFVGKFVKRMPLKVIRLDLVDCNLMLQHMAAARCDVAIYARITDPRTAAQAWPGYTMEEFRSEVDQMLQSTAGNTLVHYSEDDSIYRKQEIEEKLCQVLDQALQAYGLQVINVALTNLRLPNRGLEHMFHAAPSMESWKSAPPRPQPESRPSIVTPDQQPDTSGMEYA